MRSRVGRAGWERTERRVVDGSRRKRVVRSTTGFMTRKSSKTSLAPPADDTRSYFRAFPSRSPRAELNGNFCFGSIRNLALAWCTRGDETARRGGSPRSRFSSSRRFSPSGSSRSLSWHEYYYVIFFMYIHVHILFRIWLCEKKLLRALLPFVFWYSHVVTYRRS